MKMFYTLIAIKITTYIIYCACSGKDAALCYRTICATERPDTL